MLSDDGELNTMQIYPSDSYPSIANQLKLAANGYQQISMDLNQINNSFCPLEKKPPLILVVEDNQDNLLLISYALIVFNYTFITAVNAPTTLTLARKYQPDLILLDIVLSGINEVKLIHKLKQNHKTSQIPIIAITALAMEEDSSGLIRVGCDGYLRKPYLLNDLKNKISQHLSPVQRSA